MFGNRIGWLLSCVIVLFTGGLMYYLYTVGQPSGPTELGKNAAKYTMQLPVPPVSVADFMKDATDSSATYREAIEEYLQNRDTYDPFLEKTEVFAPYFPRYDERTKTTTPPRKEPPTFKLVTLVLAGRTSNKALVLTPDLKDVIDAKNLEHPRVKALRAAGNVTLKVGQIYKAREDLAKAQEHYEAAFSLGVKMYDERLVYFEVDAAMGLMGGAATMLQRLATERKDATRAAAWKEFDVARQQYAGKDIDLVRKGVRNLNNAHAGDMLALATSAGDRMWKVEALLALARVKFTAADMGDQRGARRLLERLAKDATDPAIKEAAREGADLDTPGFHSIRALSD